MDENLPLVITISRQLGSGGSYIGQKIAFRLNLLFLDREIIQQAAERLNLDEKDVKQNDERTRFLLSLLTPAAGEYSFTPPSPYTGQLINTGDTGHRVKTSEIQQAEADIILDISKKQSAVIIGRAGNYILRDHPKHISIFLHANKAFRQQRIQDIYTLSEEDAVKLIDSTDKNRAKFVHSFTKHDMTDATQYDLTLDTGVLGLDKAEKIIMDYINEWFK